MSQTSQGFQGKQVQTTAEEGRGTNAREGSEPCPGVSTRPSKPKDLCHLLIIVNKVDLLFQACHPSCVVFARPAVGEIVITNTKDRRRAQKMPLLSVGGHLP